MSNQFSEESFRKPVIQTADGNPVPLGMVYCIGRNYMKHIQEMNSEDLGEPVIFTKPSPAVCQGQNTVSLPSQSRDVHHEIELALIIGKKGKNIPREAAAGYIAGAAVALDLTMRDVQAEAKKKGTPWALAKGFDDACPISPVYPVTDLETLSNVDLTLLKNGETVQQGNTAYMMYKIDWLIAYLSTYITLQPGDIILTGTPEGVGPIKKGDKLTFSSSFSAPVTVRFS